MNGDTSRRIAVITGATGFLGRHCLPLLAAQFDEVHAISRSIVRSSLPNVQWHSIDLTMPASTLGLMQAVKPTHLLHLAWVTEHGRYWHSLENVRWLRASVELLQAFTLWGGQRVVTAGTCAEYAARPDCHETNNLCAPRTLYGTCKLGLQQVGGSLATVSHSHARIFHLFGPGEDPRRLVPTVVNALLAGKRAECTSGEQVRDFMFVEDAAAALVELLKSNVKGSVNVASGNAIRIRDLMEQFAIVLGGESRIRFGVIPTSEHDPPILTADTAKLRTELKFQLQYSLAEAIAKTVSWHRGTYRQPCPPILPAAYAAAMQPIPS